MVPGLSLAPRDGLALPPEAEPQSGTRVAGGGFESLSMGFGQHRAMAGRERNARRENFGAPIAGPGPGARPGLSPNAQRARGSAVLSLAGAPSCSQRRCAQGCGAGDLQFSAVNWSPSSAGGQQLLLGGDQRQSSPFFAQLKGWEKRAFFLSDLLLVRAPSSPFLPFPSNTSTRILFLIFLRY